MSNFTILIALLVSLQDCIWLTKRPAGAAFCTEVHDKILLKGLVFHGYHGVLEEVNRHVNH